MELVLAKLSGWLETQISKQNYQKYEELTEAIIRYLGNQKIRTEKNIKKGRKKMTFLQRVPVDLRRQNQRRSIYQGVEMDLLHIHET